MYVFKQYTYIYIYINRVSSVDFPTPFFGIEKPWFASGLQEPEEHKNPKCQDPEAILARW